MNKSNTEIQRLASETLSTQGNALRRLANSDSIDGITAAAKLIQQRDGRVIVAGIGKSGDISKKISSTFASIGQSSFFIHPVEAQHGDLGAISSEDIVLLISNSGNTSEVVDLGYFVQSFDAATVAITSDPESKLATAADVHVNTLVEEEGAYVDLVPMTSTTVTMAVGDAIANVIMFLNDFDEEQFAHYHPAGTIGKRLLLTVEDVMYTDINPVSPSSSLAETITRMSEGGKGIAVVVNDANTVRGVITDGDLRRLIESSVDFHGTTAGEVMTADPVTIESSGSAVEALALLEESGVTQLVVEDAGEFKGVIHFHDLVSEGIK